MSSWSEPEWDEEQLDLIAAQQIIQANTGSNGEWLPEATNDDLADPNAYSGLRYYAEGPITNWAEKARLDAVDAWRKSEGKEANANGKFWAVRKMDTR